MGRFKARDICLFAVVGSVAVSAWSVYQDPVVNRDGVLYLQVAQAIREGEWSRAVSLYSWPFVSVLIAGMSSVSGLGLELSSHVINTVLFAGIVLVFVALVRQVGGDDRHLLLAAIVALAYPSLNMYRADITRDAGYLAFYLLAVLFFFRFWLEPRWWKALLWGSSMLVAALFRVEGLVVLAALPFVWLLRFEFPWGARWLRFVQAIFVPIAILFTAGIVLITSERTAFLGLAEEMRLAQPITRLEIFVEAIREMSQTADRVADAFLPDQSRGYAIPIVFFALALICVGQTVSAVGPVVLALVVVAWRQRRSIFPFLELRTPWLALILMNVLFLLVYVVPKFMIPGRYCLPLAMMLLLSVPFALSKLYVSWRIKPLRPLGQNWVFPLIVGLLVIVSLDGVTSFGDTKVHLKQAGAWLRENSNDDSRIYLNDPIVEFYARRDVSRERSLLTWEKALRVAGKQDELSKYKFVALRFRRREQERADRLIEALQMKPVETFRSRRGDQVLIFRVVAMDSPG